MPAIIAAQSGVHGRMVQRIVAVGGGRTCEHSGVQIMKDRFLRALMRRGSLTAEHVERAVKGYNAAPSNYVWIAAIDHVLLARADCVFLAEFKRFPTEDDFPLNGRYHKICRGLQHDWHYYDDRLEELRWDRDGNPYVRSQEHPAALQEAREVQVRRGNAALFGLALLAGLVGGPVIAALIARNVARDPAAAVYVFSAIWVLLFGGVLVKARPRRVRLRDTVFRCGRCRRELDPRRQPHGCSLCGLLFED